MPHYEFDPSRAILRDVDMFAPLYVKQTASLDQALARWLVQPDTDLLLLDHPQSPVALVKGQMAYHHVAQGEIAGEPWLVSF